MFNQRQFKRKRLFLIIFVATIFIVVALFFGYKVFTENKLTRFNVEAQNVNCTTSDEIENVLRSFNLNYFYFKKEPVEAELRKKFLCIGQIESEVFYPDRLKLKITGREAKFVVTSIDPEIETNPQVVLSLEQLNATQSTTEAFPPKVLRQILNPYQDASGSAAMYLVDEEGMIFEEVSSDTAYPRLSIFSQDLKIGRRVPGDIVKKSAEVIQKLQDSGIALENLLVVSEKLIIDSNPRVIFSLNRPIDRQAASLQLILRQAKMNLDPDSRDTRSVESIDLRFDRPVVVYSQSKR